MEIAGDKKNFLLLAVLTRRGKITVYLDSKRQRPTTLVLLPPPHSPPPFSPSLSLSLSLSSDANSQITRLFMQIPSDMFQRKICVCVLKRHSASCCCCCAMKDQEPLLGNERSRGGPRGSKVLDSQDIEFCLAEKKGLEISTDNLRLLSVQDC